jgi:hypothetical protein
MILLTLIGPDNISNDKSRYRIPKDHDEQKNSCRIKLKSLYTYFSSEISFSFVKIGF